MPFCSVEDALRDIREGKMVIVVDDEDRENEGDVVMAAERVTPEAINFMATYARGWVCVPMTAERLEHLDLPPMVQRNNTRHGTAFTITVDARYGTTTGISVGDQAVTIQVLSDPHAKPPDLPRPWPERPLPANPARVLKLAAHTSSAVDLANLAGLPAAVVLCEIKIL